MLVLSRKLGEKIVIDNEIFVTILDVRGDVVKLGVEAPPCLKWGTCPKK